jgi:hypothetical protein
MAGRDRTTGKKQSRNANVRRRRVLVAGGAVGACMAAAAMATGSAAPAHADIIDTLLDPIIQPLMTSLSDAIAGFDPAAATDLTSWTDSLLASLNSIDLALPSAAEPAAVAASSTSDPTSGTYDIPLTVQEGTEPTVQATVGGANTTLLVDTGSSGLVIPWQDLGSNELTDLFELGFPTSFGFSGYSGGVDYFYLTYNDVSVDYGNGALDTTNTPVDVEFFSFPTSADSPANFQDFLNDDDVTGILGIGPTGTGPAASPLEAAGYDGVTVDVPDSELIVDPTNAGTPIATVSGDPTSTLYESVNGGTPVALSTDVDSGGVFGTIPSSLLTSSETDNVTDTAAPGTVITVDNSAGQQLYSYTVTGTEGANDGPSLTSGTSIDSGVEPYLLEPIFLDYSTDSLTFDQ